mgnify:CR=1 FL=1
MTCSYCQLAGCCSGIGACAANQKYLKAYLQRHPGKIVSGNLARQICNLGKQEEDARKLKEIKESLYFLAEQKQTNLFRMARRLLDHHGNPSLVREINLSFGLTECCTPISNVIRGIQSAIFFGSILKMIQPLLIYSNTMSGSFLPFS